MAVTQSQIDALNEAIANGERVVRYDGKMVEYRSIQELIAARNDLQAQLTASTNAAAGKSRVRQVYLTPGGRGY
jgi:hypothetical protein